MSAHLLFAWLLGWLFVLGLSLGSLWFVLVFQLTGGDWGNRLMPRAAAAARSVVVLIPLGIPLLLGMPELFPWAQSARVAADPILQHRQVLFNIPFVQLRWAICFVAWTALAFTLTRPGPMAGLRPNLGLAAAGGMLNMALCSVLAADWLQALEVHFYSTIIGVLLIMAECLSALSLLVWLCLAEPQAYAEGKGQEGGTHPGQRSHDWGSLLLTLVMLLAYMVFSQLVIVWAGNLPHEVEWLPPRVWGAWKALAIALFVLYLACPFLFLLNGAWKRKPRVLRPMAGWLFGGSIIFLYYLVWPAFVPDRLVLDPLPFLAAALMLLPWALSYRFFLRGRLVLAASLADPPRRPPRGGTLQPEGPALP